MKPGRKLGEKSLALLRALLEVGGMVAVDALETLTTIPPEHRVSSGGFRVFYKQSYNLKRSGYIRIKRDHKKNQSFFHLTPKGKLQILKYLHLEKLFKTKWDKRFRIIIFDIPEKLKKWREYLRSELKSMGFYPLQESVYITPYPVTGELDQLLKEWGLRKYFRYITVAEIDGEDELKKQFGLK